MTTTLSSVTAKPGKTTQGHFTSRSSASHVLRRWLKGDVGVETAVGSVMMGMIIT